MATFETITGTGPDGFPATLVVQVPVDSPTRGPATFTRWGTCVLCDFQFPLSELTEYDGRLVCSKNGCDKDFRSLR